MLKKSICTGVQKPSCLISICLMGNEKVIRSCMIARETCKTAKKLK